MFRIKKFALAAIALSALSLSVTGCFGDDTTTNPVTSGDETAIKDLGVTGEAGAQSNATLGSFISISTLDVLTSGDKNVAEQASVDLCFFAMTGGAKDKAGTPSFVAPSALTGVDALFNPTAKDAWSIKNSTVIVAATGKTAADFKTVQNVKDVIGSSTNSIVAVSKGGVYAIKLASTSTTPNKYAVVSVTDLLGANGGASIAFKIIE
jgi:hypothetical protein